MRATSMFFAVFVVSLTGCFSGIVPTAPTYNPPSEAQQSEAFASSMGHPTKHSPEELEAFLAKHLEGYKPEGKPMDETLDDGVRVPVELKRGKCYYMVLKLGEGATYSDKARAGYRFDYDPKGAGTNISGGPGIHGPGGAGSAGCPQANGAYEFVLRNIVGATESGLGSGPITLQLYSKPVSEKELAALKADTDRQIAESERFRQEEEAKQAQRASAGCAACEGRYQGCRGAGRTVSSCQSDFRSCAFERVGSSWPSACRMPMD